MKLSKKIHKKNLIFKGLMKWPGRKMKCDYCESKAVVNYQRVWARFTIDKNENYKKDTKFDGADIEGPTDEDNIHLCKKHEKEWLEGEI